MTHELILYPDPLLKSKSEPITTFNKEELIALGDDMVQVMADNAGIGLAAIQVGVPIRMIMLRMLREETVAYVAMCNPVITEQDNLKSLGVEGCLSHPGIYEYVPRSLKIKVKWQNFDGAEAEEEFEGINARVIQHEIDHLEGISFISKLPDHERIKIQPKLTELKRQYAKSLKAKGSVLQTSETSL